MVKMNSKTLLVILLVTLLPLSSIVSVSFMGPVSAGAVTRTTTGFNDDFTTTANQDSTATTADGWGSGTVTSAQSSQLQFLDYFAIPNPVRSVDIQGRKAYIGIYQSSASYDALSILDLTDPSNLYNLTYRTLPQHTFDVAIDGDILYVGADYNTNDHGDIFLYNVSDPSLNPIAPPIDYRYDFLGLPTGLAKQGHFLYIAAYKAGSSGRFLIFDVEDPNNIVEVNSWAWINLLDIQVVGQLAYLAHGTYGLNIVNVSNPYSPFVEGAVNTPGNATGVLVDGSIAYIADGANGVQVIDVSDPTSPSIIGSYNTPGNAMKLALQGDTLFVADGSGGVQVIDVSVPTSPTSLTSVSPAYVYDVALYGSVIVVAAIDGLYTYQYGSFTDLSVVGTYDTHEAWDVRVRDDIAYVAAGPDGFLTLNVSDPTNPVLLDREAVGTACSKLDVQGHLAFICDYTGSIFYIFDVSDPTDIKLVKASDATFLLDAFAWGDLLFYTYNGIGGGWGRLNVSNPYAPTFGQWSVLTNVTACWVQGYHIYLVENLTSAGYGFHIYDITDTSNLVLVASETLPSYHYDIFVDGDVAYTANGQLASVWDVTDPFDPTISDSVGSSSLAMGVWGFGPYMITLRQGDGVEIYDTRNINDIRIISACTGMEGALQVTAHGDYIYVANRSSLEILHFFDSRSSFITGVSTAQSEPVHLGDHVLNATLYTTTLNPYGTGMSYYLSADGGLHWESVTLGVSHTFTYPGSDLRFQVNFSTSHGDRSARLFDITINYNHIPLAAPFPFAAAIAVIVIIVVILIFLLLYFLWYKKKEK